VDDSIGSIRTKRKYDKRRAFVINTFTGTSRDKDSNGNTCLALSGRSGDSAAVVTGGTVRRALRTRRPYNANKRPTALTQFPRAFIPFCVPSQLRTIKSFKDQWFSQKKKKNTKIQVYAVRNNSKSPHAIYYII